MPESFKTPDGPEAAISIRNLVKRYAGSKGAPGKLALDGVSFDVPRGQIFGLLGPNGAGKSTLINTLAGLVMKTSGEVSIWGFDIDQDTRNAKRAIGIVPQEVVFDPFFTPAEVLEIQAGYYGISKAARRTMELLRAVHLSDKANAYARTLSGGMKRRLLIAKAMVHTPPILVLDEPTAGVDVELRRQLWELVGELNAEGVTVVLTTHYLEEAEQLCDRIAIINHGNVIACEPTSKLISRLDQKTLVVTPQTPVTPPLKGFEDITFAMKNTGAFALTYRTSEHSVEELLDRVRAAGIAIKDLSIQEPDLEDVFVELTT